MRITQQHQVDLMVKAIRDLQQHIFDRNEQIASGKRVNRPSDDPAAAERINQFRNVIRTTEHRMLSVEEGISRLNLSDSALDRAGLTFQRAKELAIQMRNDTLTAVERRNTAQEVQQLILGLASIANTQLNGRFVFGGSQTQTEPFVPGSVTSTAGVDNTGSGTISASVATPAALKPDAYRIEFTSLTQFDVINVTTNQAVSTGNTYSSGTPFSFDGLDVTLSDGGGGPQTGDQFIVRVGFVYQGDGASLGIEVGDGEVVDSNIAGNQVFSGPIHDVFQQLQDFQQALLANDVAGIETAIDEFDQSLSQTLDARANIGARVNRLETIRDGLDLLLVNTQTLRSEFEDADFAKVASDLASLQVTLEASMAALSRQFEVSLLRFI